MDTTEDAAPGRIVITGGAGFLGSHLCEYFATRGTHVVCLDNFLTSDQVTVQHLRVLRGVRVERCDVTEPFTVPGPVDVVFHCASPASPRDYLRYPLETLKAGSLGTLNGLSLAAEKGARFVLASTSEAYGDPLRRPQTETYWGNVNPVGPRAVYDEAKRFAEATTMAYRNNRGVNAGIARIFNTYGPRMRAGDGRVVPTFIAQALRGQLLTIAGDGSQTRSLCYVSDTVEALAALARTRHPGPVNIGNPQEMTIRRLAEHVIRMCGSRSGVTFVPRPVDDPGTRLPDIGLAARVLRWQPRVDWREGLERTIAWFTEGLHEDLLASPTSVAGSPASAPPRAALPAEESL